MVHKPDYKIEPGQPILYQIRVNGHLGPDWIQWFGGMTISLEEDGQTLLTGEVVDQAALHGLLKKVRDLSLPLISVNQVKSTHGDGSDLKQQNKKGRILK